MAKTHQLWMSGIAFTLIVSLFFLWIVLSLGITLQTSLMLTAVWGSFTGLLVASGYVSRAYLQRRAFEGKKQAATNITAHQQRTIEIDLPFDAAFDLTLEALKTLDKQPIPTAADPLIQARQWIPRQQILRLEKTNREIGSIRAGLRAKQLRIVDAIDFSKLDIQLQRLDAQTTRIHIESQPASIFDFYDMGKNLHYVNHLALYLRRESQQMQAAATRLQAAHKVEDNLAESDVTQEDVDDTAKHESSL